MIHNIDIILVVSDRDYHKKLTLALGRLITFLLEEKYNIYFDSPPNYILTPMDNNFFHMFYGTTRHSPQNVEGVEKEEELAYGEP